MRTANLLVKRSIDLLGSLVGLLILSPIFIVIAISIKVTSKGPVFFQQQRLGRNGRVFKIIKFRTMVINAEKIGEGLSVKSENDTRITKVGKFLRQYSLDELPQLMNVLVGHMSIVGPRPPVTYFPYKGFDNYPEWSKQRFSMKPGITGLAQVTVRNSVSWNDRMSIDIDYVKNFNIWLDLKIIAKTILKMLKPHNVYMDRNSG